MAGKFEVYKDKAGKFRYRLKAGNGQIILTGEAYSSKSACIEGVESVKKNSQKDSAFEVYEDKKGEFRFRLKASNGEIVGQGESYNARSGCMNGIESVKKNAVDSRTVEL
ncbi:MAG: hypothetical protein CVV49_13145 [Spirochaetae bacterium HGW-Spirochaetae-5]|nr:MAG: hypothetical protein CVV49_13145 [Spirochaetae bacterium HGW-Spirochaetae-5]